MQNANSTVPLHKLLIDNIVTSPVYLRITQLLQTTAAGSNNVLTSPITKSHTPESILYGLDKVFAENGSKCNSILIELEMSNRAKFGPTSIAKPWYARRESIYDSFKPPVPGSKSFEPYALGNPGRLRPISVPEAIGTLKPGSNSGIPYFVKKRLVKSKFVDYSLELLRDTIAKSLNGPIGLMLPCILFTRTQESGKTRNVWGFPIIATIFEMCFYRPILDLQSKQAWRSALRTPDDVSRAVTNLIDSCLKFNLDILSIDFKNYDNSIKASNIHSAFLTITRMFQNRYHDYLRVIMLYFEDCPIITPDGILRGSHGVPSGSTFTNEVDSIAQYGIARECPYIPDVIVPQVQGDDGLYPCYDASKVIEHFESYGLTVSKDKSFVAKDWAIFLQSLFHNDYRDENGIINGIYPIYRAMNRIVHLERFDEFKDDGISGVDFFSIRTISILENCKYHPLFEEFVTYVWSLDKYNLKYSDQGLANYVKRLAIQEGKDITFRNWSYGSNTDGLKSFESVKIINRLNGRV